jgi:adenosylhomocysteine nucleosidase
MGNTINKCMSWYPFSFARFFERLMISKSENVTNFGIDLLMKPPTQKNLLLLTAMAEEESALLTELGPHRFESKTVSARLGIAVKQTQIGERTLMVARSGMGTVNAALTVATIVERCQVDAVILLGVGGALKAELAIGDLVVSRQVMQHDYFSSLDFGHPRMLAGELILNQADADSSSALISADAKLVEWVRCAKTDHPIHLGTLLSGNEFVGTLERKKAIASLHGEALLVDMEAAGVAQVATRLGVPFVVAKTVADRLHADGSIESDFRRCLDSAALNGASVLRSLLSEQN